jgi:hypothetical protein
MRKLTLLIFIAALLLAGCNRTSGTAPTVAIGDKVKFREFSWHVLDVRDGKALLLCDWSIGGRPYNDVTINMTWENCSLRQYLNGEFYDSFSTQEQAAIVETLVTNRDNPTSGTAGGNDTTDHIFLLSTEEVQRYFNVMEWDPYNKPDELSPPLMWWLRSPGRIGNDAAYVEEYADKVVFVYSDGDDISKAYFYVRPALWLDLASPQYSKESDFTVIPVSYMLFIVFGMNFMAFLYYTVLDPYIYGNKEGRTPRWKLKYHIICTVIGIVGILLLYYFGIDIRTLFGD